MASHPAHQPLRVAAALERHEGFVGLMQRLERSQGCYAAIRPMLPAAMQASVRSGPLADDTWALLADSASVAAKLRQMVPVLEQRLREGALFDGSIRVKVQPRRS